MSNAFRAISNNTRTMILFAWPMGVFLIGLSFILMWEDFSTSYAGYLALPTQKAGGFKVAVAVALLPQVGQIVLRWASRLTLKVFNRKRVSELGRNPWNR